MQTIPKKAKAKAKAWAKNNPEKKKQQIKRGVKLTTKEGKLYQRRGTRLIPESLKLGLWGVLAPTLEEQSRGKTGTETTSMKR